MERVVRLVCGASGCGGPLGFISRDGDALVVENRLRVPAVAGGLTIQHDRFPINDPRLMLKAGVARSIGIAPLRCVKCNGSAVLQVGVAADALDANRQATVPVRTEHAQPHVGLDRIEFEGVDF